MKDIMKKLNSKDDKAAYDYAKKIAAESIVSNKYLGMIPVFASMLNDKSSFKRSRFFTLICSQAIWSNNGEIEKIFKQMIPLINDPKPTVARQCINALKEVVVYRPEMKTIIKKAIKKIDLSIYKDSMIPLIQNDIDELLELIKERGN